MKQVSKIFIILVMFMGIIFCSDAHAASTVYFVYDSPGRSITSVVDNATTTVNTYRYNSFGSVISKREEINNVYQYTTEQNDPETGFISLRNRYYDPKDGRFTTKDPFRGIVELPQTINSYAYVSNNPICFIDPLGFGEWRNEPLFGRIPVMAILRLYHSQYYYNNPNKNFGFMTSGKPEAELWTGGSLPGSFSGERNDVIMELAYVGANKTWDMQYGRPKGWSLFKPSTWGQWRPWNWHNCQDYRRAVDKKYFELLGSSNKPKDNDKKLKDKRKKKDDYYAGPPWDDGGGGGGGGILNLGGGYYRNYYNPYRYGTYGGVSLSKTADLMLNIQDIDGATYDEGTGQVILYGKHDTALPNMELDDLAVAIRSVYGLDLISQEEM